MKGFSFEPRDSYLEVFAQEGNAIGFLWELGVGSLEFMIRDPLMCERLSFIRKCQEAGYQVTLHPIWAGPFEVLRFADDPTNEIRQNLAQLFATAGDLADRQGKPVLIVVHGPTFRGSEPNPREVGVKTMASFLHWAACHSQEHGQELLFAFENRPRFPDRAITGDSHADTIAIVEGADHERVAIAWDMGHSAFNAYQGTDSLFPSPAFLERVAHVHIHDLRNGVDHYPLIYGGFPYGECIRGLVAVGYRGVINLELTGMDKLGLDGSRALADIRASFAVIDRALVSR